MRVVIQRVKEARVTVAGATTGQIGVGILVLLGVHKEDTADKIPWLVQKIIHLRIFHDDEGKMNRSLIEVQGEALVVSQFTLYGNCQEGRRPDFFQSAPSSIAEPLYNEFVSQTKKLLGKVQTGVFGAEMAISLVNHGPVTLIIDK